MRKSILLEAHNKNEFPIRFLISSTMIRSLIQANGGAINVGANYITNNKYGIKLQLIGFVQAEGFTIPINEKITV